VSNWEECYCCFEEAMLNSWNLSKRYTYKVRYKFRKPYICHHNNIRGNERVAKTETVSEDFSFF